MKRFREEPFIMGERIEMMIRKAVPQDLDALIALIVRRMAWMDEQGIEQWNTGDYLGIYPPAYFLLRITSGELFVAWDGQLCGMAALLEQDERWQDGLPAYYVHHLAADPRCPGTGFASLKRRRCRRGMGGCAWMRSAAMKRSTRGMRGRGTVMSG